MTLKHRKCRLFMFDGSDDVECDAKDTNSYLLITSISSHYVKQLRTSNCFTWMFRYLSTFQSMSQIFSFLVVLVDAITPNIILSIVSYCPAFHRLGYSSYTPNVSKLSINIYWRNYEDHSETSGALSKR